MKGNILGSLFLILLIAVIGWMVGNSSKPTASTADLGGEPTLIDFYADWCGPCKVMKPVVHQLAAELQGKLKVLEVNVDQNPDLERAEHSVLCGAA